MLIKDSVIKGEYLAWYCENVALEKSDVEAIILSPVDSIKNPRSGRNFAPSVGEIIMDDPEAKGQVFLDNERVSA